MEGREGKSWTYPVLAEQVGNPLSEFSICNRARDFGLFGATSLRLREAGAATLGGAAGPRLGCGAGLLMKGAPLKAAEGLVEPVAAAGVQAAGRRRRGHAVRVPVEAQLLLQGRGQRVHGVTTALLHV